MKYQPLSSERVPFVVFQSFCQHPLRGGIRFSPKKEEAIAVQRQNLFVGLVPQSNITTVFHLMSWAVIYVLRHPKEYLRVVRSALSAAGDVKGSRLVDRVLETTAVRDEIIEAELTEAAKIRRMSFSATVRLALILILTHQIRNKVFEKVFENVTPADMGERLFIFFFPSP